MTFKPLLSATITQDELSTLQYPVLVSPKYDGIRALKINGQIVSRNLKPIRNKFVQSALANIPDNLDGELIVGDPVAKNVFKLTTEGIMSEDGEPDFKYILFDRFDEPLTPFAERIPSLSIIRSQYVDHAMNLPAFNVQELLELETHYVNSGYEGIMIRAYNGKYKFGRSTLKEGILVKLKRWLDAEFEVLDFVEQLHNNNEATKDNLGRTVRSKHKDNLVPNGKLGAVVCKIDDKTFEVGTGFDDAARIHIWENKELYRGRLATVKYQMLSEDGIPRFPVFKGWRDNI